jgi:hypothetical protein
VKDIVKRLIRQVTEEEEEFASYIWGKGLLQNIQRTPNTQ